MEEFILKKKSESWIMRLLGLFMDPIAPGFMSRFWTTMGRSVYTPTKYDNDSDWGTEAWVKRHRYTVAHELVHVRQYEKYGPLIIGLLYIGPAPYVLVLAGILLNPILGLVGLALVPLTAGLAWGRWWAERSAYMVQVRAMKHPIDQEKMIEQVADTLWKNYLWCWPKKWVINWYRRKLDADTDDSGSSADGATGD